MAGQPRQIFQIFTKPFFLMKNVILFCGVIFTLFLLTGCPEPAPKFPVFELGKPFVIAQGATMQTADNGLFVQFSQVTGDSRCPEGVECIWAGRADCAFVLTKGDMAETVTISSGDYSQGGSGQANFQGYNIKLNDIAPAARAGEPIKQEEYRATVTVTKI